MGWIGIVLRVIPVVIKLMQAAEGLLGAGTGEVKKNYVIEAVKAMVNAAGEITSQPELWEKIEKSISLLIDAACIFLFPKKN